MFQRLFWCIISFSRKQVESRDARDDAGDAEKLWDCSRLFKYENSDDRGTYDANPGPDSVRTAKGECFHRVREEIEADSHAQQG